MFLFSLFLPLFPLSRSQCFLAALQVAFLVVASALRAEVRVVESGPGYLRVAYEAEPVDLQLAAGRSWLVGLPLEGEVSLEVVEARASSPAEAISLASLDEDLEGPAFLGARGFVRDQRVVELVFSPRREGGGPVQVYDRVVVDLRFEERARPSWRGRGDRWAEMFYDQTLINYEQARDWRRRRGGRRERPSLQSSSVERVRVVLRERGIYRITGADLESAGIDLAAVDPTRIRMLYGGGRVLPLSISSPGEVVLEEQAIVVEDGGDGRLGPDDAILFYGEPVNRWEYRKGDGAYAFRKNPYTHDNVYWLEFHGEVAGKRAPRRSGALQASAPLRPQSHRVREHVESEEIILIQTFSVRSGYEWYWEDFQGNARNYSTVVQGAVADPVDIRVRFFGWTNRQHRFTFKWNDEVLGEFQFFGARSHTLAAQAPQGAREGINQLGLVHEDDALTRLDWYELEYSRQFVAQRNELVFDSPASAGTAEFQLSGFAEEEPRIFEVSSGLAEIGDFVHDPAAGTATFQDMSGSVPRSYLALGSSRFKRPLRLEVDRSGDLRGAGQGAEYVIITHGDFSRAANRLAAWRAEDDRLGRPLRTSVVDVQDIYDEFSGGMVDPAAVRNFLKHAAEHWNPAPFFVVLLGDGTYDYKNNSGSSPGNWIPTYQDWDSSYDEWFVRVAGDDPLPDMALGRLTVQTEAEADLVVDKVIDYDRRPEVGLWQSRVLLIADDLSNLDNPGAVERWFLWDAETMAENYLPPELDLVKLYLAQYPLEGRTKPRARDAFIRSFNEGALILTFLGHGNWRTLAHERMFVVSRDLGAIDNGRRLPLMYMAASQVGPFDDPVRSSMPEDLLKLPEGGIIGMISATRVGYHGSNMTLAFRFHEQMYRTGRGYVPVGLALMEAKQLVRLSDLDRRNVQRYSLIGDPATRLAMPPYRVEIEIADTLQALSEVPIRGRVVDERGVDAGDFEGRVWVKVYDSAVRSHLDGLTYKQLGGPLFRGRFQVERGRFETAFRVPKDITYQGVEGSVSAYVWGEGRPSGFGSVRDLVLAGTAEGVEPDREGPQISLGFLGRSGTTIPNGSILRAVIRDESGINITGETGHEIELAVDEQVFKVTEFFIVEGGSYQEGVLEYPLPDLEPGEHTISLKVWDSFNNSARAEVQVRIAEEPDSVLADLLFFPNPMQLKGHFTYNLKVPASKVRIRVFSVSGRLVDEMEGGTEAGFNQVAWNPSADLANGAYLYSVRVQVPEGREAERTGVLQVVK